MTNQPNQTQQNGLTLVLGSSGKTGSRIVDRLTELGVSVRRGSRSAIPAFDWNVESTWEACLSGVTSVYITYASDLAIPGATDSIRAFVNAAKSSGVQRVVLLSGRGESEAQACERIVMQSGLQATVIRAAWFNQNFSEGAFIDMVHVGNICLPSGSALEPFVDVDDIADVAVAALTEPGHEGQIYEVTGPQLLTFGDIARELSAATGRPIAYSEVPHRQFVTSIEESGAPDEVVWIMDYLFSTVLDGRNAHLCDGVSRALGRPPKDFATYARSVAASGIWKAVA